MKIKITDLKSLVATALKKQGYEGSEIATISEVLLYAQLRGNNQGIVKLIGKGIPKSPIAKTPEIEKETKLSALINAHQTHAMITINQAVDLAVKKAHEHGMGLVGVNNINTSSGALGYYTRKIARSGLVAMVMAGSMETVAASGSYQPIFGTNPLSFAVPTNGEPLVFDITTAAMAYFGVVEANTAGRNLPEGIAYDKEGKLTTKPAEVLDGGALKTFDGGHKGSGLSMIVQILTGPLTGSYFTGIGDVANNWGGHLVWAFDPDLFGGKAELKNGVSQMIEKVKGTKKLPGTEEILVPGERGDCLTKKHVDAGEIDVEDNLLAKLKEVAQ